MGKKISALPTGDALTGEELAELAQNGVSIRAPISGWPTTISAIESALGYTPADPDSFDAWTASNPEGQMMVWLGASVERGGAGVVETVTMTIASPCVVTWTDGTAPANGTAIELGTTGALPTGLSTLTVYYVVNSSGDTCNLAATAGGSAINTSGSQSGTHNAGVSLAWGGLQGCYPDVFSQLPWADGKATFWNCSQDGARTSNLVTMYTNGTSAHGRTIPAPHDLSPVVTGSPKKATLVLGCNAYGDAIDGTSTAVSIANLTSIAEDAQADGYFVVNVIVPFEHATVAYQDHWDTVSRAVRDGTIPGDMVIDMTDWLPSPHSNTSLFADGIHPTALGANRLGNNFDAHLRGRVQIERWLGPADGDVHGHYLVARAQVINFGLANTDAGLRYDRGSGLLHLKDVQNSNYKSLLVNTLTTTGSVVDFGTGNTDASARWEAGVALHLKDVQNSNYVALRTGTLTPTTGILNFGTTSTDGSFRWEPGVALHLKDVQNSNYVALHAGTLTSTSAIINFGATSTDASFRWEAGVTLHLKDVQNSNYLALRAGAITGTAFTTTGTSRILSGSAASAGGTAGFGYKFGTGNFGVFWGSGAPTLSALQGSLYLRTDGTTTNDRAYINTNGTTGWTALTTAA